MQMYFANQRNLPPTRDHDYKIPLVEGAQPVNIRPYRHPPTKKNSIEGMVASQTMEDHALHLRTILKIMRHHKLYAKRSKCVFRTNKVEYLGHVISAKGVATDPSKVEAMSQWLVPTNLKQLRGFLGLTVYYRRFIQGYASISKPLTQLLRKNTDDSQTAFEQLKQAMVVLLDQRMSTPIQLKWLPKLMGFDYEIQYKKGVENVATDALSMLQFSNEKLQKIITKLQQGQDVKGSYSWANQELRRKGRLVVGNGQSLKIELLKQFHEVSVGGHSRVRTTTNKICSVFYWKKLRKHVKQLVLEFHICQRYKLDLAAYPGLLQPLPISTRIWSNISMDFIDSLPKSQCKIVILVVVDRLSKGDSRVGLVDGSLTAREEAIKVCNFHLKWANDRMNSQAGKRRTDKEYVVGDWVYLKLQPHRQVTIRKGKQHKLSPKYYGPFQIEARVGQVAYKLKLPDSSQIHNVFHISKFKKCRGEVSKSIDLPICNEQGVTKVKHVVILDRRLAKRGNVVVFVLVEWANGTKEDATWELIEQIQMKFPSFKI
ncbi:putative mitochondrial protein [Tanacetum coccineum]|uniref:Mitochondrial protein n=1 Tax=Tanacetum coccineum TaxID=301880 RepID=A0ABQ5DDY1_9ASTR